MEQNLELRTRTSDLTESIGVSFERTNTLPRDVKNIVEDVDSEFEGMSTVHLQKAIRNGSLGCYGKTYGELTTQEICIWIRKYISENPSSEPKKMTMDRINKEV